jgi:DNA-binding transcriptional LysR family regulator
MKNTDLNEIAVFVKVAQAGSFTLAAKQLNMPKSTVSARVSSLEKRLGTTFIQRTTRRLSLTQAGRGYFERCLQALGEIEGAENEIANSKGEPQGILKITAPATLGSCLLPSIVTAYVKAYPKVSVDLILSDRTVDLVSEGVDLAIRGGELGDSSLVRKKLGISCFAPFASASYLKKSGTPAHPKDLREHQCLQFPPLGRDQWELTREKTKVAVSLSGRIVVDDLNTIKELALSGNGIALLPTFLCDQESRNGKLVRILPEWVSLPRPVSFVYPSQRFVSNRVQAFIAMATAPLQRALK